MRTATVRDLRNNFKRIAAWIAAGETVEITRRGKPFAVLSQSGASNRKKIQMPDFQARTDAIFGEQIVDTEVWLNEIRKERF